MLVFNEVSQYYKGQYQHQRVLQRVSLTIDAPLAHIAGPNGSGKTTLLLLAAGLIKPQEGMVTFNGQDVLLPSSKKSIGISASKIVLPAFMTVAELLKFHAGQFGCQSENAWTEQFGLDKFMATKVSDLSLGNYKKLSLITALMHEPDLLLLDEPSNGLDERSRLLLESILSNYPGQVVMASHDHLAITDFQAANKTVQSIAMQDMADGVG